MKAYDDARAREYDDWWHGSGLFADRDRPGWDDDVARLGEFVAALPPRRTLDVACGTVFLTRHLRGDLVGLDASARMLAIARGRIREAPFVHGDALALPFKRCFTGADLADELHGELVHRSRYFLVVRA